MLTHPSCSREAAAPSLPRPLPARADDAALLDLGRRFETSWQAEEDLFVTGDDVPDDIYGPANDKTAAIVEEIGRTPATSLPGLLVKARAILWCYAGEPFDDEAFLSGDATTDRRLAVSLLLDLLSIHEREVAAC